MMITIVIMIITARTKEATDRTRVGCGDRKKWCCLVGMNHDDAHPVDAHMLVARVHHGRGAFLKQKYCYELLIQN